MPILFKSSKFRTYAVFILSPLFFGFFLFSIIAILSYGHLNIVSIIFLLISIYLLISLTEYILKLKYIEVSEDHILVNHKKIIEYKNIFYVYTRMEEAFGFSYSSVLWYLDLKSNKLKVILAYPEGENFKDCDSILSVSESKVTKFIKEKAIKSNPNYLKINNPRYFLFSISPTFKFFK